jgi:bifunctional DNase/RNase
LVEGIFYSKLVCESDRGEQIEIDTRTSDAVAIALRFESPIYTYEFILSSAGIILDETTEISASEDEDEEDMEVEVSPEPAKSLKSPSELSMTELQAELKKAIDAEDYEKASRLRDEIKNRKVN